MKIDEYDMPDDLYYHSDHSWAKKEGEQVVVGLNDFAQKLAGTIKRVVTLEEDDEVSQGKPCGTISSGKWTGKFYSPISGEIVEINEEIEDEPKIINTDPYGKGWLFKVEPEDIDELNNLLQGDAMVKWLKAEIAEHKT